MIKKDIGKVANIKNTLYLCNVFFIVLDLRLTRFGTQRSPFFYVLIESASSLSLSESKEKIDSSVYN